MDNSRHSAGDEPPLVTRLLRLVPTIHFDAIRIVFNDQGREGGEDDGEASGAEGGNEVRTWRSELIIVRTYRVASRRADCVVDLLAMGVAAVHYGVRDDET